MAQNEQQIFFLTEQRPKGSLPRLAKMRRSFGQKLRRDDIIEWWIDVIEYIKEDRIQEYILYSNGGPLQSGLTIDCDFHVDVNEVEYIHEFEPDFDEEQHDKKQIVAKFTEVLHAHPYRAQEQDIKTVKQLCDEVLQFIGEYFVCLEPIRDYVIVCRNNLSFDDTKTTPERTYYRYGFHAYVFDCAMDGASKYFIKKNFKPSSDLVEKVRLLYPQTQLSQYFDMSPLIGTTCLPLTAPPKKAYPYYFSGTGFKIIKNDVRVLMKLNPFRGMPIQLKPEYVTVDQSKDTLMDVLKRQQFNCYEQSVQYCYKNLLGQFREDFQFKLLLQTFSHPPHDLRFLIVRYLYGYLYDEKKVNQSIFLTQVCFYIIMCEKVEEILQKQYGDEEYTNWIDLGREHSCFPQKVINSVNSIRQQINDNLDKSQCYVKLFQLYNTHRQQLQLEPILFDPLRSITYKKFINYLNVSSNGIHSGNLYNLLTRYRNQMEQQLFQYAYSQIESNILVYNAKCYYFQNQEDEEDMSIDNNKFHMIEPIEIEAKMVALIREIQEGVEQQLKYLKTQNEKFWFCCWNQQDQDNEDYIRYKYDFDTYMNLNELLARYSSFCRSEKIIKNLSTEKKSFQKYTQQIDTTPGYFGVYNGVIGFDGQRFKFYQGHEAKKLYISKSTMFMVRKEFLDDNSYLVEPDKLPKELSIIYEEIQSIYNKIFANGRDIDVFHWKIFQIMHRILEKNIAGEKLFIAFGTGGDGKTTAMQAILNCLGQGHQSISYAKESRKIISSGYTSQAKSTILQTKQKSSNQHDSGGMSELPGNFFCLMTELSSSEPLVAAAIKTLTCGSGITTRQAHATEPISFYNQCFLELQTNYFPVFDQVLDIGLLRRIVLYIHSIKFVTQAQYDRLSDKQKLMHCVADENIRTKLLSNFDYIDVLGYMCLIIYTHYEHRKLDYVPEKLLKDTQIFFNQGLQFITHCMNLLVLDLDGMIVYNLFEEKVGEVIYNQIGQKRGKQIDIRSTTDNHIAYLRTQYVDKIVVIDKNRQETQITDNDFATYEHSKDYLICIKQMGFENQAFQTQNKAIIEKFFGEGM